jgi:hypothetical protein
MDSLSELHLEVHAKLASSAVSLQPWKYWAWYSDIMQGVLYNDEDARRRVEASSLGLMVNEKFGLGPPGFGARFEWDGIAGPHMRRVMLKLVLPAMETYVQVTHG